MAEARRDFDLREYLTVFRRRRWVFVGSVVVVIALGAALSLLVHPTYQASAVVLIPQNAQTAVDPTQPQSGESTQILDRDLQNEIIFARGDAVVTAVKRSVGRVPSVTITALSNADGLTFAATAASPYTASKYANAYATAYLVQRRAEKTSDYEQTAEVITSQINSLRARQAKLSADDPSQPGIRSALATLQGSQADLAASGQLSQAGGALTNRAESSQTQVSPNIPRNLVIAAFLGLIVAVWLTLTVERLDDSIKTKEDLDAVSGGMMVLGLIPWTKEWKRAGDVFNVSLEIPQSPATEAYRTLRTSLSLVSLTSGAHTIAATSASAGEGKTATVANLGVAFARAGQRTLLVDCDLRRPRLHTFFGLENRLGLTSVFLDEFSIEHAIRAVDSCPGLSVLSSGPSPPNPSELLSGAMAANLMATLREHPDFDVVIVDCPPVLPVPDALQISREVDGVLIVARVRTARKRQVARMIELLGQMSAPIVGVVLNGVKENEPDAYGYGAYSYDRDDPIEEPQGAQKAPAR